MDETQARTLLHRVVAGSTPLDPVDLDHVVRVAKRRQQRRNRQLTAAAAGLVLIVTLAVAAWATGIGTDHSAPPALRPTRSATPSAAASADKNVFDPATDRLSVGWFPAGLPYRITGNAVDELTLIAQPGVLAHTYALVEVAPVGRKVPFDRGVGGATELTVPGRPNAGTRLYRLRDGNYQLRWEWTAGAPAVLTLTKGLGLSDPAAAQAALRVQATTRVLHNSPVRSPITVPWPKGIPLRQVAESRPHNADVTVITMDFGADRNQPWAEVVFYLKTDDLAGSVHWNKTLNGHRAWVGTGAVDEIIELPPADVSVRCILPPPTAARMAQCRAIAANAQLVADPAKPSTWPTLSAR